MIAALQAFALAVVAFVPVLGVGDTVPALPLTDQAGHAISIASFRGNALVVSFVYTRCPDANQCPAVSAKFARMQAAIGAAPIRLLEITLDPGHDTPAVLRAYGRGFGQDPKRWTLATGSAAVVDELAARLGVVKQRIGPASFAHSEGAVVLDRTGRIAEIVDGTAWNPDDVAATARAAAGGERSFLARAQLWLQAAVATCGGSAANVDPAAGLGLLLAAVASAAFVLFRALKTP